MSLALLTRLFGNLIIRTIVECKEMCKELLRRTILGLQSISWNAADNVCQPRRLDPTMELITYSFVLYLQHGCYDVICKLSIPNLRLRSDCVL